MRTWNAGVVALLIGAAPSLAAPARTAGAR